MPSSDRQRRLSGTGLVHFSGEVLEKIDDSLAALLQESKAKCALVIDRTGVILASEGDFHPISEENMGAVAAGVIAALNTMVSRATSPEVSVRFYGSDVDKIHFVVLAERLILCMIHSRHTTTGQIRSAARGFVNTIGPIIEKDRTNSQESQDGKDLLKSVQYIESKLNELFKDLT